MKPPFILVFLLCALVAGCVTPDRTTELTRLTAEEGYRWPPVSDGARDDVLLVLTASGGGTRSAALTLGTLRTLDQLKFDNGQRSILDEIDIISSVSGGSVTSAYFALRGREGLADIEEKFIRQDGIGQITGSVLNPVELISLATPSRSRLDLLTDYFKSSLFGEAKYADLMAANSAGKSLARKPLLILNAADMSGGYVFSFTQSQFDLICSDLSEFKLAEAVSASAAFPVALTPLTLKNFSPCNAQLENLNRPRGTTPTPWPPKWIEFGLKTSINVEPARVRRARQSFSYLNLDCLDPKLNEELECKPKSPSEQKTYLHLLDGGIADNLGLTEPLRLLESSDMLSPPIEGIFKGDIKAVIFIVVNAAPKVDLSLDRSSSTPGIFTMLKASIGSGIDGVTLQLIDRLREQIKRDLKDELDVDRLVTLSCNNTQNDLTQFCKSVTADQTVLSIDARASQRCIKACEKFLNVTQLETSISLIDFDYIKDERCRDYFKSIETSWTMSGKKIDDLLAVAPALLHNNAKEFGKMLDVFKAKPKITFPDLTEVCKQALM